MTDSVTNKIILSADSTCDLDQELKERYHVHYFPLHIILDGKDYKDGIDITQPLSMLRNILNILNPGLMRAMR